jgi:hypothetical protein
MGLIKSGHFIQVNLANLESKSVKSFSHAAVCQNRFAGRKDARANKAQRTPEGSAKKHAAP